MSNALELTLDASGNYCSNGTEFNNNTATADGVKPSNWQSGPNKNLWFKFKPSNTGIANIVVQRGNSGYYMVALYDDQGVEITSDGHHGVYGSSKVVATGLDSTKYYYISIDSHIQYGYYGGSFSFCIRNEWTNDYKDYALELTLDGSGNYCSNGAEFNNYSATADGTKPSNWQSGPNKNLWFKFKPSNTGIANIIVQRGNSGYYMVALYDDQGVEIASDGHHGVYGSSRVVATGLDSTKYYYISIDSNLQHGYYGSSFSFCIRNEWTNDYKDYALELTLDGSGNYCSNGAEFNNYSATADGTKPSNWQSGPNKNLWFKFKPSNTGIANIIVQRGNSGYYMVALYDDQGVEIASDGHHGVYGSSRVVATGLDSTKYYYISIDSNLQHGYYGSSFSFCIRNEWTNDYKDYAQELTLDGSGNYCSNGAEFNNYSATADGTKPSNWQSGPNKNLWFKFMPNNTGIANILVQRGNSGYYMVALYDDQGVEVASESHQGVYGNSGIVTTGLDPTKYYYISIDSHLQHGYYGGAFSFCIRSEWTNDYKDYAQELTLDVSGNYCSSTSEFNNYTATADGLRPENWQTGPNKNLWYKFQTDELGIANITVTRNNGGGYYMLALYDSQGNEMESIGYQGQNDVAELTSNALMPNSYYYIAVDSKIAYSTYGGEFTICISVSPISCYSGLWAINSGSWDDPDIWSDTEGGLPISSVPCATTNVYIKGFGITLNSLQPMTAKYIELIGSGDVNSESVLDVQSGQLVVTEKIKVSGIGTKLKSSSSSIINVSGSGN
ncbi:hypothetical protein [Roseivirga sp.]|uniref:hypothetical protein n=1 Tax=Roseivirga sp. TaxID=1964215 RepID=UPI003B52E609